MSLSSLKCHSRNQTAWEAINHLKRQNGQIKLHDFLILCLLGSGDTGNVYLCKIQNSTQQFSQCYYAIKVLDRDALRVGNKLHRADMEREILGMVDHPFLPTLYAEFEDSCCSCMVMTYCPGGDMFALLGRHPRFRLSVSSAK